MRDTTTCREDADDRRRHSFSSGCWSTKYAILASDAYYNFCGPTYFSAAVLDINSN